MVADIDCVSSRTRAKRRILDILESSGLPSPSPSKLVDIDCNSRRRAKRGISRFTYGGEPDIFIAIVFSFTYVNLLCHLVMYWESIAKVLTNRIL